MAARGYGIKRGILQMQRDARIVTITDLATTIHGRSSKWILYQERRSSEAKRFYRQGYGWDLVKRALLAYKDREGDLLVPQGFIIPEEDEWEKILWGVKLGTAVNGIRNYNTYKQYRPELEKTGFDYDPQMTLYGWDLVKRALLAYKDLVGVLLVPTVSLFLKTTSGRRRFGV
jgi:hypothetical protein